jgi:hypothetical protein
VALTQSACPCSKGVGYSQLLLYFRDQLTQGATDKVCAEAGFHADHARRQFFEGLDHGHLDPDINARALAGTIRIV